MFLSVITTNISYDTVIFDGEKLKHRYFSDPHDIAACARYRQLPALQTLTRKTNHPHPHPHSPPELQPPT